MKQYKLVSNKTGAEIKVGDTVTTFRGEPHILMSFDHGTTPSSTGRVYVSYGLDDFRQAFYPSVIDAKIVESTE